MRLTATYPWPSPLRLRAGPPVPRILGLHPIPARPLALGHNPLTTKGTGVLEEQRAVVLKQRIEQAPIARSGLLTATEDGAGRL